LTRRTNRTRRPRPRYRREVLLTHQITKVPDINTFTAFVVPWTQEKKSPGFKTRERSIVCTIKAGMAYWFSSLFCREAELPAGTRETLTQAEALMVLEITTCFRISF
jgi:hypothetical protein